MLSRVIVLAILTIVAAYSHIHHKKRVLRSLSELEHRSHMQCVIRTDDVVGVKNCSLPVDKDPNEWRVACMFLEFGEKITQDCWIHQEISLEHQCKENICKVDDSNIGVHFCCCLGSRCNEDININGVKYPEKL